MSVAVIFESNGELFAFSAESLIEINSKSEFTHIPRLPDFISGVISLMGDVIPVIDFRRKLGFPDVQYTAHSCLMVVSDEGMTAAVRVDGVVTSIDCTDENFLPVPEGDSVISGYITAENGDRISLVNVKKLLEDR